MGKWDLFGAPTRPGILPAKKKATPLAPIGRRPGPLPGFPHACDVA